MSALRLVSCFVLLAASAIDARAQSCAQLQQEYEARKNELIQGTGYTFDSGNAVRMQQLQAILPNCRDSYQPQPQAEMPTAPNQGPSPRESLLMKAFAFIGATGQLGRSQVDRSMRLSDTVENQPTKPLPPIGFTASWEKQAKVSTPPGINPFTLLPETAPRAATQPNSLLNSAPLARTPPTTLSASPSKGTAVNCGAGQRPSAQGNFCELAPNQAPQNRSTQSTPPPTGSYATCVALSANTGSFASKSSPPSCVMADGYTYYSDGRTPTR